MGDHTDARLCRDPGGNHLHKKKVKIQALTSFDKHYFISSATYASALPYFISDLINGTSVVTAAFADALKEAGVLMRDDAEMEQGESADEYGDSVLQNSIPIAAYSHAYLSTQGRGALFESVLKDGTDLVSHLEKYLE